MREHLRRTLRAMKSRCYSQNTRDYSYYGARGITICQEWLDNPDSFVKWALENGWKKGLSIDRIDNDGPYHPDNCRFVTHQENNMNRRDNVTNIEKGTRICYKCEIEKPLEEFHRNKTRQQGRQYICKTCRKESS